MVKRKKINSGLTSMNALISCISTTLMLLLLGLVTFFITFAYNFSNDLRENFHVTIILDDEMTRGEGYALQTKLKHMAAIRHVTYISKEKALKEQAEALESDSIEFKDINPMPASFEVSLKAEYANKDSLKYLLPQLEKHPKVLDVSYPQNLMDSLNSNIRKISFILLILALLLTLVSFVNINNTIQLSVFSRRFLIHTMKLVGASWGFIRRPFMKQGLVVGIIAALLAIAVLGACVYGLYYYEPNMMVVITWRELVITAVAVLLFGIIITSVSAYISVNRFLKMTPGELYKI